MYEIAVIMKWLAGIIALIAICSSIYYSIRLSKLVKQGEGTNIFASEANNEIRDSFGILLPCALLVYLLFDLVIVIMRNTA